ncbi:hypothetical protein [Vulcanisaeta souniana]|uniref:hypothetical protein n=1 Tax=Vulcanisaeta souniana TaxID=164452 RepID=UPI00222E327F|nr:hypothetical protein [Vulcanisaeta souniana]
MVLVVVAVLSLVFAFHVANRLGGEVVGQASPNAVGGSALVSINVPIYVVGPATLIQGLINAGINQSTIKPTTTNQLTTLPNNSVVVIDWDSLLSYSGSDYSVITGVLNVLFRRGDLVIIHVSSTEESPLAMLALAQSWAKAYGSKITTYPIIAGQYLSAFGSKNALVFGSSYKTKDIIGIITNYQRTISTWGREVGSNQVSPLNIYEQYELQSTTLTNVDPCQKYVQNENSLGGVVFDYQPYYNGVDTEAYNDGNGTLYYDTCIFVYNGNGEPYIPAGAAPYYSVATAAWIAYSPSSTMISNNGYINYFIGTMDHELGWDDYQSGTTNSYLEYESGANPASTSSNYVVRFTVEFGTGGVNMAFEVEYSESPSSVRIQSENTAPTTNTAAFNNTWRFYMGESQQANQKYIVAFAEDADEWVLPQGLNTYQTATFNNELGVNLVTSVQDIPCTAWVYNYEVIWTQIQWVLQYNPGSSPPTGFSAQIVNQQSPYDITGVTSYSESIPYTCGDIIT